MPETQEQYKSRLLGYTEGKDPLAMQREAPQTLAELVHGVPVEKLRRRPAPQKWSVGEILAHLAEDEITCCWRYRQMIEHKGVALNAFNQDEWARLGDYASWDPHEALQLFRILREANLRMFTKLTEAEWQSYGVHAERGKMTVRDLARQMAGHDVNHIEQVRRILRGG